VSGFWPSVAEERAMAFSKRAGSWRTVSMTAAIVFFVLTMIAIGALYGSCDLLLFPKGWVTAIVCIAAAEVLIRRGHLWGTGVESALWIGGLFAFIFALPSSGKPEAILTFVAAAAISGWRVRNALFGALAVVLVTFYLMLRYWLWSAMLFSVAVAVVALLALVRTWKRPSTEKVWNVLAVVMPVAGLYGGLQATESKSDVRVVVLFVALAGFTLAIGIRKRVRGALIAGTVDIVIAGVAAHDFIPFSTETRLILIGAATLAIVGTVARALRGRERGFVLIPTSPARETLLSVVPAFLPTPSGSSSPQPVSGGGQFGGAGGSGQF
jgi:hypothetical protein